MSVITYQPFITHEVAGMVTNVEADDRRGNPSTTCCQPVRKNRNGTINQLCLPSGGSLIVLICTQASVFTTC